MKKERAKEKADQILVLMNEQGMTLEMAINYSLDRRLQVDAKIVWTYQGDMKCPICSKYSKIWTKGRGNNTSRRLYCSRHGVFYYSPGRQYWHKADEDTQQQKQA